MNWIEEIRYEIKSIKETPADLRKFGVVVGSVFFLIALLAWWKHWLMINSILILSMFSISLILFGLIQPRVLRMLNRIWMSFAIILGSVVARIILAVVFFVIVTPISIFAKATGKQFYFKYKDGEKKSYWIEREKNKPINYERMN